VKAIFLAGMTEARRATREYILNEVKEMEKEMENKSELDIYISSLLWLNHLLSNL
jgi:hypothetical protein